MIKLPDEVALMAVSGQLLAQVFDALGRLPLQGRSTLELNDFVERMIVDELHARPASKGQYGFLISPDPQPPVAGVATGGADAGST